MSKMHKLPMLCRPGLTLAIHHSGEPLPEPIRVSAGFLVSGRSG